MKKIDRRQFIKSGLQAGVALGSLAVSPAILAKKVSAAEQIPDISQVHGNDYFKSTIQAVENLGGIEKFVSRGDTVGLLANSGYKKPGTYTRPDVMLAVAYLCFEAGAKKVVGFKKESDKYWQRSPDYEKHKTLISKLQRDDTDYIEAEIPKGKILKDAKVLKGFLDYDKVINIPVVKDHGEIGMTCTLKNCMGISSLATNLRFHAGPNVITGTVKALVDSYHDKQYLAQCIADLNLVRNFDLYVVDATEFITTNGPSGPGELKNPDMVVAGTDRVAMDTFCCQYLDRDPEKEIMIKTAYESHLGEMDLTKMIIHGV